LPVRRGQRDLTELRRLRRSDARHDDRLQGEAGRHLVGIRVPHVEDRLVAASLKRTGALRSRLDLQLREALDMRGLELAAAVDAVNVSTARGDAHADVVVSCVEQLAAERREGARRLPAAALADDQTPTA